MNREIRVVCSRWLRRYPRAAYPLLMALLCTPAACSFVALAIHIEGPFLFALFASVSRQYIQFPLVLCLRAATHKIYLHYLADDTLIEAVDASTDMTREADAVLR